MESRKQAVSKPLVERDALTLGRTSKVTSPPWDKVGLMDPPPFWVFVVESLSCALQDEVYMIGCGAAGACDVTQDCGHLGADYMANFSSAA